MSSSEATWRKTATDSEDASGERGISRRNRIAIAIGGAAVALWLVLYFAVGGDFYGSVEEVKTAAPIEHTRVGGMVVPGSLEQQGQVATLTIEGESGELLDVRYVGDFPGQLSAYDEVVAEGSLGDSGPFEATELLVKCPDDLLPERITNEIVGGAGLERLLY